ATAVGGAVSSANSGAWSNAQSTSGDTGNVSNDVHVRGAGGAGGNGGDRASARSGRAGDANSRVRVGNRSRVRIGAVTGGDSIANVDANGGDGGGVKIDASPTAASGNSGASTAQSSSTNTGNT